MVDKLLSYSGIETLSGRVYHINTMMPFFFAFVDSSSVFHVDYIGKDGERHTAALEGVRIKEHQRRIGVRDDKSDVTFSRVDPSTVLFTLPSFDEEKAPRVIDSMFSYINSEPKVKNLIIDLRNNGGGSMKVMFQLLKYLPANILPCYSDEISSDDLDSGRVLKPQLLANPLPKRKRFNGDLYVLIDNGSYSASIIFSYYVRHDRLGLLIGEPTGSSVFTNVIANDSLDFPCGLSLKFSIATLWLPDLEYYRDTMEPIYPDIEVSSGDALDKAFEIISSGGIKSFRKGK